MGAYTDPRAYVFSSLLTKMMKRLYTSFLFAAVVAQAQLTRGFISGTVTDPSGAMVPDVRVQLSERATGIRHEVVTNETGVYRFVAIEPGIYSVTFERDGLQPVRHDDINLGTAQEVVINQTMAVAASATTINVESITAGAQLSKATPTVERTLGRDVIDSLPLGGFREVSDLALLSPGVAAIGTDATQATYTANGQRAGQNTVTINGLDNKDPQFQFLTTNTQPEMTAEVQVRTNSYSAEFGRGLGAQVSIVTMGGTNQLHGEALDRYAANWMSAPSLANKSAGLNDVRFSDHQVRGSLGGALRRNRTFFFMLYGQSPHREGISANGIATIAIPTPAGYAALAKLPLPDGQTAESRQAVAASLAFLPEIHSQARAYQNIRAVSVNGVPIEFGTTRIGQSRPSNGWLAQLRLDHRFSDRDTLTYFFNAGQLSAPVAVAWPFSNNTFGNQFASWEDDRNQQQSLSHIHIFSPVLVNELRVSTTRHLDQVVARDDTVPRSVITNFFTLGPAAASPFIRPRNTSEAQNVLTWTRSRHSLKFGAHVLFVEDFISGMQQSIWTFNTFADFWRNQANSLALRLGGFKQAILSVRQNYFLQDDFKLRPDLTLNIGVRYQVANVPEGLFGAATPEIAAAGVPGPVKPDRNDVAPRFGVAYSLNNRTVIRGGWGMGYGLVYEGEAGASLLQLKSNYPQDTTLTLDRPSLTNAFPVPPVALPKGRAFNPLFNFFNYPAGAKNPTTHFYSLSIQREFARSHVVEIGYLGSRSYHLYTEVENNPAILTEEQARQVVASRNSSIIPARQQRSLHPEWGLRTSLDSSGYSNYNAGYIRYDRRLSRGLLLGANYTWSATLGVGENNIRVQDKTNFRSDYARSAIDVPHRFVVHYVWQTPGRRFYSGWRIAGFSQWQSGRPFSILTGVDSNGDGGSGSDRPDYNPGGKLSLDPVTGDWRSFSTPIDGSGIVVTPLGSNGLPLQYSMASSGNLGRNTFRGPALSLWNLGLAKIFPIGERVRMEARGDANNLSNHRNFGPPVNMMNSINFGRNTSTPPSRIVSLGLKLRW